ncbi:MAG TPA: aminotransferase class V-fold PLP-dependent enzyme [Ignavibacteriaceae bacterium]|nr:aminotransferase class V-fold PLP-dependent enzyme [Ignavibacteriaceae bacterium]
MNISEAREMFPFTKKGKIYFNHASSGPLPLPAAVRINEFVKDRSEDRIEDYPEFLKVMGETKSLIAGMINTTSTRIAFLDNTSNGLNLLAQSIQWRRGDRILLNDAEFPANIYPFINLRNEGVEVDLVKSHNHYATSDDIIEAIKPETKLISISYVQFLSGYRVDLNKIGEICKEKDIILSLDAIQALPAAGLDVKEAGVNFLSCGTQKWMLGLPGLAFVFIDEELQKKMRPRYVGWLSVNEGNNFLEYDLTLKKSASAFQSGTLNYLAIYSLNSSLKFLLEFGLDQIRENVLNNTIYFMNELQNIGIEPALKSCGKDNLAGIITIEHPKYQEIFETLTRKDIICSVREGMLRFSPYFYNIREEIDRVIREIKTLIY